ncbi:MAG: hypothetical protein ACLQAT_19075 [Candidatus Binataceae bacterium]
MAIERLTLPSTGIYKQRISRAQLRLGDDPNRNDFGSLLDELASKAPQGALGELGELETTAKAFLKKYVENDMGGFTKTTGLQARELGIDYVVNRYIEVTRPKFDVKSQEKISREKMRETINRLRRLEQAADACKILFCITVIRSQLKFGDAEQAVAHGIRLGRAAESFKVRDFEREAWTGGLVLQGASSGGSRRRDQHYQKIAVKFRDSKLSQRKFALLRGIPRSTVQRALKRKKLLDSPLST